MDGKKSALVTGSRGQDGSYLVEQLAADGWFVVGVAKEGTTGGGQALPPTKLGAADEVDALFEEHRFTRCFHLAAVSTVHECTPETTAFNRRSTQNLLRACARHDAHMMLAGSCIMFGAPASAPQSEQTPFVPTNEYGRGKLAAHALIVAARNAGQFAGTAILFNHESERRPERFVSRAISKAVAEIKLGRRDELVLGNLLARRDWGYAPEYTRAMIAMLDADQPGDFVLATGTTHTVAELAEAAFSAVSLDAAQYLRSDPDRVRPEPAVEYRGDASKAKRVLGWAAETGALQMIAKMVLRDLETLKRS